MIEREARSGVCHRSVSLRHYPRRRATTAHQAPYGVILSSCLAPASCAHGIPQIVGIDRELPRGERSAQPVSRALWASAASSTASARSAATTTAHRRPARSRRPAGPWRRPPRQAPAARQGWSWLRRARVPSAPRSAGPAYAAPPHRARRRRSGWRRHPRQGLRRKQIAHQSNRRRLRHGQHQHVAGLGNRHHRVDHQIVVLPATRKIRKMTISTARLIAF